MRGVANLNFKERARGLRKGGNLAEVILWRELKDKKLNGLSFDRQSIIGNYIADFYCAAAKIVIEIDGSSHDDRQEYDRIRDEYMQAMGIKVIRVQATDVLYNLGGVLNTLEHSC